MSERRFVNLEELGRLLQPRVSLTTLRRYVAERGENGMPIEQLGSNGVGYRFDLDLAVAWWREFQAKRDAAEETRRDELEQWSLDLYGDAPPIDDAGKRMSPAERKTLAEATKLEDYNRRQRGELVVRVDLEAALAAAVIATRADLMQIPAEAARRLALAPAQAAELEQIIRRRVNGLAERLGTVTGGHVDTTAGTIA